MAKAKLIESPEKFIAVLERSQLFASDQLDAIKKLAETTDEPIPIARTLVKKGWLTKWQASQLLSGFYQLTLGKYRLVDHLGKGELGNVYLAENPKLGRQIALKKLSAKHTDDPEQVQRFLGEASAAAALDHRNIVHIHDVSSENQRHYVVMEYVGGQTLQRHVDTDGPLSFAEATRYIKQAAEGLQYAHEQGVIHRDIKPTNIMVDEQGALKILDIGVGHLRTSKGDPPEGNTGELMMSAIAYMAPEHARGRDVDARCDIYSLGGVLYFSLTGRAPFSTKNDAERASIKASKRPIPLTELRADTPPWLVALCDRMTALDPNDRFASMKEVLAALQGTDDVTVPALASNEQAELAEAEIAEAEMAETDGESVEDKSDVKEPDSEAATPGIKIDVGDDAKPAVSIAPGDFSINTKRRKKKKSAGKSSEATKAPVTKEVAEQTAPESPPETAAAVATADDGDKPEPAPGEPKKGLSKGVLIGLIGGACVAALMLIAGIGVGAMMWLGGGDPEVAQAPPVAEGSENAASELADSDAAADDSANGQTEDDGSSPAATDSTAGSEDTPFIDAEAMPESAVGETAVAASGDATEPGEEVAGAEAAGEPAAAASEATPPAETASAVAATEPPKDEPTPESPAPETPAPEEPAPEKPAPEKPAAKTPEPKKPAAPPKPETFVFQPAVDLPTPAADAPELTLGQINIQPDDAVFISLDGGDIAAAGRFEFSLQNAQDGVAPRDWEFYLSEGNADPTVIATMTLPAKDLKFNWTPAGIEHPMATNLRNCSLRITAGQDRPQDLALRVPQQVAPITIDVEKSAMAKLPLEGAPDRSSLKLEVTVKGHKSLVEPAQIELGKGGEGIIYFGENQQQAAFALKLDASINARGVQIKTDPHFLVPGNPPVRLNKGSIKNFEAAQAQQAGLQNEVFKWEKAFKDPKVPAAQKQRIQATLPRMKQQLDLVNKTVEKMTQLKTDMAAVSSGTSLQFRVFSDTFEKQIDLIVPDPNAAPVAP